MLTRKHLGKQSPGRLRRWKDNIKINFGSYLHVPPQGADSTGGSIEKCSASAADIKTCSAQLLGPFKCLGRNM
jgi:hypothetical protein